MVLDAIRGVEDSRKEQKYSSLTCVAHLSRYILKRKTRKKGEEEGEDSQGCVIKESKREMREESREEPSQKEGV